MRELPKKYDHKETEKRWQGHWLAAGTYAYDESATRAESYVIDTPPPTVSGMLHMGHIFSYTQADFIARYQRMKGKHVFYPMGFDDNGLPTERLVEKVKKVRATDLSREEFITLCEGVAEEARAEFQNLFTSTALSVDWQQEYHTISEDSRRLSQASFIDLFNKDRAYRKLQPMLWDPVDQTAIAQAEVEDKEFDSHMNHVQFTTESGDAIEIATTRPELLPACVAVFYHPEDARYQRLAGQQAITPLFGVTVPLLADEAVQMDKGTGLVMCCTYGDETDIHWWQTHDLPTRLVLNTYGKLDYLDGMGDKHALTSEAWPSVQKEAALQELREQLQGKKVKAAREIILQLLDEAGVLLKQDAITHAVKCAERSGAPLEILPTHQWFIKVLDQKEQLKEKAAECNWYPHYMKLRIDQWIEGLSWDWCISRQRYFGVPFPVWYSTRAGEEGKILLPEIDQLPVNPLVELPKGYTRDEVEAEQDVMDTWATSSISPQLSSHGISSDISFNDTRHKQLFPADLRPQAHEIIRTWAFYTITKAHLHEDSIPWKNLMISGWCLASDKTKMSKSKGNVVTPVALIEEKGTDAVRFWASTSKLGTDTAFSEDVLKIGKKLVTKLWNAAKFASLHFTRLEGDISTAAEDVAAGYIAHGTDLWVLSKLQQTITKATEAFEVYEYADARAAVEDFFWNDFCDNYLEICKARAYDEAGTDPKGSQSAIRTVYYCLEAILRLFAPFVPHITEELYSHIFETEYAASGSVHARGMWPNAAAYPTDQAAQQAGENLVAVLEAVRKRKAEMNVSIKWPIDSLTIPESFLNQAMQNDLIAVTNSKSLICNNNVKNGEYSLSIDDSVLIEIRLAEESDAA